MTCNFPTSLSPGLVFGWLLTLLTSYLVLYPQAAHTETCEPQSSATKPVWAQTRTAIGKDFDYFIGTATKQPSFIQGYETALGRALKQASLEDEIKLESVTEIESQRRTEEGSVERSGQYLERIKLETNRQFDNADVRDVYWSKSCKGNAPAFKVMVLVGKRREHPNPNAKEPITKWDGAVRSAVLPGWGQFHKAEPTKGWTFSVGTSATLVTGIVTGVLAQRNYDDAAAANQQDRRDTFLQRGDRLNTVSWVTFGLASGFYLTSVLDGAFAQPNVQYYARTDEDIQREDTSGLALVPQITGRLRTLSFTFSF
jgi:hypothetical protein